jgi:hypothetical protein
MLNLESDDLEQIPIPSMSSLEFSVAAVRAKRRLEKKSWFPRLLDYPQKYKI